jgi:hypothetical protein
MATSKIKSIVHTNNWTAPDGTEYFYHLVTMINGESGKCAFKRMGEYVEGETLDYEINNDRLKVLKKSSAQDPSKPKSSVPRNYTSTGKRSPEDYLGFIYGYAKDIHVAEINATGKKVPLANLKKNVEEMYAHIISILNPEQ